MRSSLSIDTTDSQFELSAAEEPGYSSGLAFLLSLSARLAQEKR
jgi:hypothetical protein